jgi:hypothetical protein
MTTAHTLPPISTEAEHRAALAEIERLWPDATPGTAVGDLFTKLIARVEEYERRHDSHQDCVDRWRRWLYNQLALFQLGTEPAAFGVDWDAFLDDHLSYALAGVEVTATEDRHVSHQTELRMLRHAASRYVTLLEESDNLGEINEAKDHLLSLIEDV